MNDFDPSLDEIVSAYVDGAATADERARVESDPVLLERVATFRRLRDAVAAPVAPADEALRQALITRALGETAGASAGATVHSLRRRRSTTLGPIAAAAAVIAMFFGLGTWLVASQDNDDAGDSSATAAFDADSFDARTESGASATSRAAAVGGAVPQAGAPNQSTKSQPNYVGAFADEVTLRQAVISAREGSSLSAAATAPAARATADATTCQRTDPADATVYSADLRGRPVTIVVTSTRLDMYDDATCVGPTNLALVNPPLTFGDPRPTSTTR